MDTKKMIVGMVVALALVLGWHYFIYELGKAKGWDFSAQSAPATQPAVAPPSPAAASPVTAAAAATGVQPVATAVPSTLAVQAAAHRSVNLGSVQKDDPKYALGLELSSRGASISKATLNSYLRGTHASEKKVDPKAADSRFVFQQPQADGAYASLATRSLTVNGVAHRLDDASWQLDALDDRQATFSIELADAAKSPLVRVRKRIEIAARPADARNEGGGYEIIVRHTLENLSGGEMKARLEFNGPTAPPREMDRMSDVQAMAGHNKTPGTTYQTIEMSAHAASAFTPEKPTQDLFKHGENKPFVWAGLSSSYFDALVLPATPDGQNPDPFVKSVQATLLNPQAPVIDHVPGLVFATEEWALPAKSSRSADLRVYLGPKVRELLKSPYYAAFPRMYETTLTTSGGCSWCTFQFLVDWLVGLLNAFHWVLRDWGLAIIALVILVRLVLHPITKKSTISMHKMSKLAPEMERLKKKYGDNKEELNRAMMQFYKEHGATPVLGCLPMFLQMPIWIALWSALQGTFELRQAPFLQVGGASLTWIHDLAKPDRLFYFPGSPINLWLFSLDSINLLPILMGVVFWLQQKYQPQQAAMTPEQEQQKKMMQWMTLLFPLMLYTGPSGLNLYILTSTTIGIIESKRIRDHIKARELAAGPDGRVVIDVEPVKPGEQKRPGGLKGLMARAQEYAEQVRKEQEKKKRK